VHELWPETAVSSRSTGSVSVDGTAIERRVAIQTASQQFIRLTTSSVDTAGASAKDRFSRIKRSSSSAELTPDVHQFGHEPAAFPKSIQSLSP